jgi:hypothetical protein
MSIRLNILLLLSTASLVLPIAFNLTACAPAPRTATYFQAHLTDAKRVAAACQGGAARGPECLNAQAGIAAAARDARMATYRKSF